MAYQPALDGVRGIAIAMVLLFHLRDIPNAPQLGGGWLGVDVFFVLSGYLITSLLLAEHRRTGRVSLRRFYARRALRLVPLSVVIVAVSFVGGRIGLASSLDLRLSVRGALSVLLYVSNFVAIHDRGNKVLGSLTHCWSLSIEEQFYLVWPAVLLGVTALVRRHSRLALGLLAAAFALAQGLVRRHLWQQALARYGSLAPGIDMMSAWRRFFFGSFQRPDGLVIGCLLAIVLSGRRPSKLAHGLIGFWAAAGAVVGVMIVARANFPTAAPWVGFVPLWGLSVFNLATAGVVAYLVVDRGSIAARVVSVLPLRWLGRRAYGIYLIHLLPLNAIAMRPSFTGPLAAIWVIVVTLLMSAASFRWLEQPFLRRKARFASL